MYKFLFSALISFSLFLTSNAQNDILNKDIGWEEGAFSTIKTNIIKDREQGINCVLINDSLTVKGFIFNTSMKNSQEFEIWGLANEDIIGGYIFNEKVSIFAKKRRASSIKYLSFDLKNQQSEVHEIPFRLKDDKFIGQINADKAFLYITANKKEPIITVYRFLENNTDTLTYDFKNINTSFNKNDLWQALTKQEGISRSVDVAIVQPDLECDIDVANSPNKLYLNKNNLLLVMNKKRGETMVFTLDLDNQEIAFRKINYEIISKSTETIFTPTFNSFLFEDRLYYIDAETQKLTLITADFNTGKEISIYETPSSETISFKNTPLMQEGSSYSSKPRELGKTSQLIRKMLNGKAVITVSRNTDKHEITIGSFKEVKQSGGGMMMGGSFGAPMYVPYSFGGSWNKMTRFKSLFEPQTGKHISGEISLSAYERLQDFVEEIDIPKKHMNIFSAGNKYYLTYYNEEGKSLIVTEFER